MIILEMGILTRHFTCRLQFNSHGVCCWPDWAERRNLHVRRSDIYMGVAATLLCKDELRCVEELRRGRPVPWVRALLCLPFLLVIWIHIHSWLFANCDFFVNGHEFLLGKKRPWVKVWFTTVALLAVRCQKEHFWCTTYQDDKKHIKQIWSSWLALLASLSDAVLFCNRSLQTKHLVQCYIVILASLLLRMCAPNLWRMVPDRSLKHHF